jgi:GntR family transcriptional regulator, transcriptional repressor for pyruvate dehydrogenase complex
VSTPINANLFQAPQRKSSVDTVIETVEQLLLTKQLKPGDRFPNEMELTKSLSISRGSIREAMKILASYGIVEIKRGDGTYVSKSLTKRVFDQLLFQLILSDNDKKKLFELRQLLEMGIARIVIANATSEDIRLIEEAYERMERQVGQAVHDVKLITECDVAFHAAIARATENELIEKIYAFTLELFAPTVAETHRNESSGTNALQLHKAILDGLKARDLQATEQAVEKSLEIWSSLLGSKGPGFSS